MKPGRELDALVANKIFDIPINSQHEVICPGLGCGTPHKYSTDIKAAWTVVEKLQEKNLTFIIQNNFGFDINWVAEFNEYSYGGETAAHAICLAGLKAMGVKI